MRSRNPGKGEDNITQNQFTAYLLTAIRRKKITYLQVLAKLEQHEVATDFTEDYPGTPERLELMELWGQGSFPLENAALERALERMEAREKLILLARVLDEQDFESLAAELGLTYKGVTSAYYRLIRKIKKELGGDEP